VTGSDADSAQCLKTLFSDSRVDSYPPWRLIVEVNDADGDRFACRYEAYLTDPRREPRKTTREVELNIRVRERT
jgi:hypothetical protein